MQKPEASESEDHAHSDATINFDQDGLADLHRIAESWRTITPLPGSLFVLVYKSLLRAGSTAHHVKQGCGQRTNQYGSVVR